MQGRTSFAPLTRAGIQSSLAACTRDHPMQLTTQADAYPYLRSNTRHLYQDVIWFGVLAASSMAFLSVYAAHLGASALEIGLLTAGPALVNLVFSLPAGHWLEGKPLVWATFQSSIWSRLAYFVLIPLPWLFGPSQQVWALISLVLVMSVPGTLLAIAFNALFADVVPPEWRGALVGRRNAILAVSLTITSIACGLVLTRLGFPGNYQVVYALGAAGAALSSYHLGRLRLPAEGTPVRVGRPLQDDARPGLVRFADTIRLAPGLRFLTRAEGRRLLRLDRIRGPFGQFLIAYLLFYTVQSVPVPLFPLFWVEQLRLSDGAISVGNALFYVTMMLASLGLRRLSAARGHRQILVAGAALYGLYPLLTALAHDAILYWVASLVGGAVWGILNGGLVNRLMERVPADDRPAHMALHNLALNLGILLGSLGGPILAAEFGLRNGLLTAAGLRLIGGLVLSIWA